MTFSEFAQMLYPFCGNRGGDKTYQSDLVVSLVGNIIAEADDESCALLDKKGDYLTRIFSGSKPFPRKDAAFVLGHLDKGAFESYISELTDTASMGLEQRLTRRASRLPQNTRWQPSARMSLRR